MRTRSTSSRSSSPSASASLRRSSTSWSLTPNLATSIPRHPTSPSSRARCAPWLGISGRWSPTPTPESLAGRRRFLSEDRQHVHLLVPHLGADEGEAKHRENDDGQP